MEKIKRYTNKISYENLMPFYCRNDRKSFICGLYTTISLLFLILFGVGCTKDDITVQNINGTDILSFYLEDGSAKCCAFSIRDSQIYVMVPNQCNLVSMRTRCVHNGIKAKIDGTELNERVISDYSDFSKPHVVTIESSEGVKKNYSVCLFDLPVVLIDTKDKVSIVDKETWIPATMKIIDTSGKNMFETDMLIKGRGNGSWKSEHYKKKSYSIKLDKKREILGYPKSKRWVLLGTSADKTKMRTPLCFKLSEWSGFNWSPKGANVEFVLNGKLMCNYFLCEQIRVEKNRINIQEMTPSDTIGESLTGGALLEVSTERDEKYQFLSQKTWLTFMFKCPNDSIHNKQFSYFTAFIDTVETILSSNSRIEKNEYERYVDIDSYIRWWLIHELCLNLEEVSPWKNLYMYKDRGYDSKLYAGPPWDFDWGTFWEENVEKWLGKDRLWFANLFYNPHFCTRVKDIWKNLKEKCDKSIDDFVKNIADMNKKSVLRDQSYYPIEFPEEISNVDNGMEYDESINYLLNVLK